MKIGAHRKVVTVLFCDVVGSTALGESVDPEALQELLGFLYAECCTRNRAVEPAFGRRPEENGSGTDHGAAGLAFVVGKHAKKGIVGGFNGLRPASNR